MDIGTESVGMACTDERYNLLRAKGKDLWAVRLFDEAKDASERRMKRTARRRLQRRRQRIEFLQGVFAPFMEDELFFIRLNNSGFYEEDKDERLQTRFSLFADADYTDADLYKKYPTIFHLRAALIEGEKADLRLYYLALHHIVKYRGHFLFEGEDMSGIRDIGKLFASYNAIVDELALETDMRLSVEQAEEFRALATSALGLTEKKKKLAEIFQAKSAALKELLALLAGAKAKPAVLFGEEYADKYKEEKSFSFKELNDDAFEEKAAAFEEEHFELLKAARAIYNFIVFEKVLDGQAYISRSMVALYEKHATDLRLLKKFVKNNYPQTTYYKIFRSRKETANYVNYVGYTKTKGKKYSVQKCKSAEDFFKFLKKTLAEGEPEDKEAYGYILTEMENGTFLPKILNADNGLFPHQINGMELDMILNNLCKYYPEFSSEDEDGYSPAEKIKKIFLFKVPYYIGPLNANGKNAWIVRKKEGKITPWNFDELVDKGASNEGFIRRMTNKCTYLHNQDVLPKGSMYYQAFDTLNQLNKLTVNGKPISVGLKQSLFDKVFLRYKKVGKKQIKEYLVASGECSQAEAKELTVGGFDAATDLKANMSSYVTFKTKFGELVDERPDIFEDIILWHTLNTDKSLVEGMIAEKYGDEPAIIENIKWLKGMTSFKEFGRLSKKLLCELVGGADPVTGEIYTVLGRLYHTNYNFNQLLNLGEYTFDSAIEAENVGMNEEVTYEDITELYVSPMVRRGIWQALQMADEYVKAVGKAPDKIFVEVTRQDGEKGDKGRTVSRKNKLLELYKGLGTDCRDIDGLSAELSREETTDSRLRQERLYLYFLQLGRCAYTGERIDIDQLSTDLYDVDHIVPQSITKDDSLDNKVLVKREKNAQKTDVYPLPAGFTDQQGFWKLLKAKGLMSETKYARLTRTKPLDGDDFRDFVNRQLVVTNQTVKAVAELLKRKFEAQGTRIVYSKANNVDDFKQRYRIVKCRETNDLHHARDAYLNIVVGNVYDTKFTCAYDYFYRKQDDSWREYNLKNMFNRPVEGAWTGAEDVSRIKAVVAKTSMQVTRFAYTNKGGFYNETVYGKDDEGVSVPRKACAPYDQTQKYGGFKSLTTAYFAIVESKDKKGNWIKTIEAIPVLVDYQSRNNTERVKEYLIENGLVEPKILVPKLKMKSLVSVNGYRVWIAGITGKQIIIHNAQQWFTDGATDLYVKNLVKLVGKDRTGRLSESEKEQETFEVVKNRKETTLFINKEANLALYQKIIDALNKKIYQGLSSVRSFVKKLEEKKSLFEELRTFDQVKVLLQIIRVMKCNAEKADLTLLKDGANCGGLLIGKNITDVDFAIIHQSPCVLTERIQKI